MFKRRYATRPQSFVEPWVETHGYPRFIATRCEAVTQDFPARVGSGGVEGMNLRTARWKLIAFVLLVTGSLYSAGLDVVLPKALTAQEQTFINQVTNAIATTNVTALVKLEHPTKSEQFLQDMSRSFYRSMLSRGCIKVELKRADPAVETERTEGFVTKQRVRESLPVKWVLTVYHPSTVPGGTVTTTLRAGVDGENVRFTTTEPIEAK